MERYILPYDNYDENNKIIGFCVAHNKEECLIDEDECEYENMKVDDYINLGIKCNGRVYVHIFNYPSCRIVHDIYFLTEHDAKTFINELEKKEKAND